jgi:hypothetical protein
VVSTPHTAYDSWDATYESMAISVCITASPSYLIQQGGLRGVAVWLAGRCHDIVLLSLFLWRSIYV